MTRPDLLRASRSAWVKAKAASLGFEDCRIADATFLDVEAGRLEQWLKERRQGEMDYLERHFDLRVDPQKLVPGAKSVIVLAVNYYPSTLQRTDAPKISKYAYGRDYHKVIRKNLKLFLRALDQQFGGVAGRGFVDSAPVMEKAWAQRSGLGWMGKHTNILTKKRGSFFFLAVLITNLELASDDPVEDHCGSCTACIDACPTDAITEPYKLDASKCISYLTIELKSDAIPDAFQGQLQDWMFGCDICQDVCPWNRFSKSHAVPEFQPKKDLMEFGWEEWNALTQETFDDLFEGSAVKRAKFEGLKRNLQFLNQS